jgi:hypothetical protein
MTTTIRTNDKIYSNGSISSNFPNLNNWFISFQVYIYFNDVLTRLRSFAFFFIWISEMLMRLIFQNYQVFFCLPVVHE